ncbi:MAG: hypothetical protein KAW12_06065 [Candidatus Aminicenantes bacterium]|nr:hypothetical protein [Candidatus Aminicenantes bacterium]
MAKVIGIRREDKNRWERRTPLAPDDVKELIEKHGIKVIVQPSKIRIFSDEEYEKVHAEINEDLSEADLILAVKEIPIHLLQEGKTYAFFSHTIKGQSYNMDMLKKMVELKCSLIDYERILDEQNRRLLFFGKYAGLAGMVETLHAYGQKLKLRGYDTPLEKIKQAYEYDSLEDAAAAVKTVGEDITILGLPEGLASLVVGFAGYGNTSIGGQEIFDLLPHKEISPADLGKDLPAEHYNFYKVVFREEDMMKAKEGEFSLQDYFQNPGKYESQFGKYIPYIDVLMLCIYWTEDYPRLLTKEYLIEKNKAGSNVKLSVIGDITCDIEGAVEITYKSTKPDMATFTYFAGEDAYKEGIHPAGVTVMAIDNLPCEFPRESSVYFSSVLRGFIDNIAAVDFEKSFENLKLTDPIRKALILQRGAFTPDYRYMEDFIK